MSIGIKGPEAQNGLRSSGVKDSSCFLADSSVLFLVHYPWSGISQLLAVRHVSARLPVRPPARAHVGGVYF